MITHKTAVSGAGLATLLALCVTTFTPAQAQIGLSINLGGGGPVYAAPEPPPPEYVGPAYAAPAPVYGPEYVPDYYDYHHRPRPRPRPVYHGRPQGGYRH